MSDKRWTIQTCPWCHALWDCDTDGACANCEDNAGPTPVDVVLVAASIPITTLRDWINRIATA